MEFYSNVILKFSVAVHFIRRMDRRAVVSERTWAL